MSTLAAPPKPHNTDGDLRRVGVELEFSGLGIEEVAAITKRVLGGEYPPIQGHSTEIAGTVVGKIKIMLDARIAHMGSKKGTVERFKQLSSEVIGHVVKPVTPLEIITEPISFKELEPLDRLVDALDREGAKGTNESVLFAYGLHLNPEIASEETSEIIAVMKAFALADPVLRETQHVDFTRDAMGWIKPWPRLYVAHLLDPDYWPDQDRMIDDYLRYAGNRNADLDMLPLFHHLDRDRVERAIEDELVKGRPAYHFRMPNTVFETGSCLIADNWNRWVAIEKLAHDRETLTELGRNWFMASGNEDASARFRIKIASTLFPDAAK